MVRSWLNDRLTRGNPPKMCGYSDFRKYVGSFHTNWSTFYHHVEPEGCEQITHFPVINDNSRIGPFEFGYEMHLVTYNSLKIFTSQF